MFRIVIIISLVLFTGVSAFSQEMKIKPVQVKKLNAPQVYPSIKADTFLFFPERNFRKFTMKDGLAQMTVKKIFIDSRERMWVGTYGGGANIYDGKTFITLNKNVGLPNNNVFDFAEDKNGEIWMATDKGVAIYDGKKIRQAHSDTVLTQKEIWAVFIDSKNRKWLASANHGFFMLHNGKLTSYTKEKDSLPDNRITCFAEDKNGNIYIGTWSTGLLKYDGKKIKVITHENKSLNMIRHLSSDVEGKIWCATTGGIFIIDNEREIILTEDEGLPDNNIRQVFHVGKNKVWIATNGGISFYNGESFESISTDRGLPDNRTTTILQDRWGTVWTGTAGSGLVQLLNQPFYHFTKESGFPCDHPSYVFRDSKNHIWVASDDNGLFKFNWNYWEHFSPENGFRWKGISTIYEDSEGNIWFGTETSGAIKYDHHQFYEYGLKQNLLNSRIWTICEDKNKDIWLGTNWSAYRLTKDSVYIYNNNNGQLPYFLIISLFRDSKNNLWVGTFGGGAAVINENKNLHFNVKSGLQNNAAFSFAEDNFGNIWISNYGEGIVVIQNGVSVDTNKGVKKYYNTGNVLQTDVISFVKSDKDGNIWLGSAKGITKVKMNGNVFKKEPDFIHYGYADGFTGEECRLNGFAEDAAGTLWIPSNKRLTLFLLQKLEVDKIPPKLSFTSLKLDLKNPDWNSIIGADFSDINLWTNIPQNLTLTYDLNNLQFEFMGVSFDRPEAVEYQWVLIGSKEEWSPWSKTRTATFSNLPPGKYTLKVRSRNGDKIISNSIEYDFEIYPPFWQTWWFRIVTGVSIFLLLFGIYKWRTFALLKRQAELETTVEQRTQEVVNQKHLVEEKQKEILDSINYAKRIQYTLLANDALLKENLKDHFVLFKPKDIVSGDFYWATVKQSGNQNVSGEKTFYLAVCDCTGHGVPGAFMSLLNISFLNEAINEKNITEPHDVLNFVRNRLIQNMEGAQDGMDGILIKFEVGSSKLEVKYAAANNNPILISHNKINELPADKMPVGKGEKLTSFTLHHLKYNPGDILYLYTDGYADQFGGPKARLNGAFGQGKKFKYSNLNKILLENSTKNTDIQSQILNLEFEKWKGDLEQVDDVCIIGLKL